jgi:hypothetical protein
LKTNRQNGHLLTAVWRNWGFRQTLKLVLYLEVGFLFDTFGLPNPQLTPSHETLVAIQPRNLKEMKLYEKTNINNSCFFFFDFL